MKTNFAIILLLLSFGLFYVFTNPQYKEIREMNALASEYRDILRNVSSIVDLRESLSVTYETLSETDIERVNKVLPDNVETVQLAHDLDGIASRFGISIKDIQVTSVTDRNSNVIAVSDAGNVYEKAVVSFKFVSNYDNFMNFLADLERNLRITDVVSLSFQTDKSNLYDYTISVETHWLK